MATSKKMRVREIAKELDIDNNKVIIQFLEQNGISGKVASSNLEDDQVELIKKHFSGNTKSENNGNGHKENVRIEESAKQSDKISTVSPEKKEERVNQVEKVEAKKIDSSKISTPEIKEPNKVVNNPEENKSSISNSIKERMAQRTQSLKDKFSSRISLRDKLDQRKKDEEPVPEIVKPQETQTLPNTNEPKKDNEYPRNNSNNRYNNSNDPGKRKVKEFGSGTNPGENRSSGYQGQNPNPNYQGQRPPGSGYQGQNPNPNYQGQRPPGSGYQGQNPNPNYQGQRPPGSGYQGQNPNPNYQGQRPPGSGYQGQNPNPNYQGQRPPGSGYQGQNPNPNYQGQRPPGGGYQGQRPGGGAPVAAGGPPAPGTDRKPDNSANKAKSKKDRDNDYKRKQLQEEERQLSKAIGNKKKRRDDNKAEEVEEVLTKEIEIFDGMNVKELADRLRAKETEIIKELFMKGIMVTVNQKLDVGTITTIATNHGFTIKADDSKENEHLENKLEEMSQDESLLENRPPVVTIMGHVDHGKTSLLDSIRKTKITEGEAGGITQHIGAYQVHAQDRLITFLDTPGHEAFTAMRARGANATDIVVLVVAADDGIMPQTIEAINHAKAASVPIIVAINKMDKADANPDRVKQQLAEHDLVAEDWGGTTVTVPVSARAKTGIDELLEMIILTADLQDIKANPNKMAQGVIIESKLDKGKGPVATVLIQAGTLKIGDNFVIGTVYGKVRAMFNYLGKQVKEATPSSPVQVTGFDAVPSAGEIFKVVPTDKEARDLAEQAQFNEKESSLSPVRSVNLESISEQIGQGKLKELNLVIKADVQGSGEALEQSLSKVAVDDVKLRIIHSAVGDITETDVSLASASSAIVIAFNVRIDQKIRDLAEKERVDIRAYNIIYRVIEDVQKALEGLLEPELEEVLTGKAEIRTIFTIGKSSVIAGSYVIDGKVVRNGTVKIMRGTELIHTGKINALKRFKDDVKEVANGFECGISIDKFNDLKEGDIIESYVLQAKVR